MSQHTPGPWRVGRAPDGDCRIYADSETHALARTYGPDLNGIGVCALNGIRNKFDAQLISAAPDLLSEAVHASAILAAIYVNFQGVLSATICDAINVRIDALEAAIGKATGNRD